MTSAPRPDSTDKAGPTRLQRWFPRRRLRRLAVGSIVALTVYAVAGFLLVPWLIRTVGIGRFSDSVDGSAALRSASFNPFTFALVLEGFELLDDDGAALLAFERADGNVQGLATVFLDGYHLARLEVTNPQVYLEIDENGATNLIEVLRPILENLKPVALWPRLVVPEARIRDADLSIAVRSLPEPFEARAQSLDLVLRDLDTHPDHDNPLSFSAESSIVDRVTWEGSFRADPLSSTGEITIEGLDLGAFTPFGLAFTHARVRSGTVNGSLTYDFAPAATDRRARVTAHDFALTKLDVEHEGEPWIIVERAELGPLVVDASNQTASLERLAVVAPAVYGHRDENGQLRIMRLLADRAHQRAERDAAAGTAVPESDTLSPREQIVVALEGLRAELTTLPWQVNVTSVTVDDGTLDWTDLAPVAPVHVAAHELRVRLGPVASDDGWRTPIELALRVGDSGSAALDGEIDVASRAFEFDTRADSIDLADIGPYVPAEWAALPRVRLAGGLVDLDGTVRAAGDLTNAELGWDGTATARALHVVDADAAERLLDWESLAVTGSTSVVIEEHGRGVDAGWQGHMTLTSLQAALTEDLPRPAPAADSDAPLWTTVGTVGVAVQSLEYRGSTAMKIDSSGAPTWTAAVDATLDQVRLTAPALGADGIDAQRVTLSSVALNEAHDLRVGRVDIARPDIRLGVAIARDGTSPPLPQTDAVPRRSVHLESVTVEKGRFTLRDTSEGGDVVTLEELHVEASNVRADGTTVATIDLRAPIESGGLVQVRGTLDPLDPERATNLDVAIDAATLAPFDATGGHYLGYEIERGRLDLRLPVQVTDGRLEATAGLTLDEFHLGKKVESPAAPDVPIKLGLDLMRGLDDRVTMDVPISGDLQDPEFQLMSAVSGAFVDILAGAIASPFTLLASAFSEDKDLDLSSFAFAPGTDVPLEGEVVKLDVLARALQERDALNLGLVGLWTDEDDRALRAGALRRDALAQARRTEPDLEALSDERWRERVRALYVERFGVLPETDVPTPATPPVEGDPPRRGSGGAWPVGGASAREQAERAAVMASAETAMLDALVAEVELAPEALGQLAEQRARSVAALLIQRQVDEGRLRVEPSEPGEEAAVALKVR